MTDTPINLDEARALKQERIIGRLKALTKQGEDYIWRTAKDAVEFIEEQDAEVHRLRAQASAGDAEISRLHEVLSCIRH